MPPVMPAGCGLTDVGCYIKQGAKSVIGEIVGAFADGCIEVLKYVSTFWMEVPSPQIASGSGGSWTLNGSVSEIQSYLMPLTATLAVLSYIATIVQVAFTYDAQKGIRSITRQLATITGSTLAIEGALQTLIYAGDKFSPWIISRASGHSASEGLRQMLVAVFGTGQVDKAMGAFLIIFILTLLSSLAQAVFMVLRGAVLTVLAAFVPTVAAGTATDEGWMRFKRISMWLIGFALYKPVAAVILATGIKLTQSDTKGASESNAPTLQNAIFGFAIITLAALALPAFIKLLDQTAAMGSSSAFNGGGLAAGAVATGAAMVSLGGGGAAAAAGGGSSSTAGTISESAGGASAPGGISGDGGGSSGPSGSGIPGNDGAPGSDGGSGRDGGGAEAPVGGPDSGGADGGGENTGSSSTGSGSGASNASRSADGSGEDSDSSTGGGAGNASNSTGDGGPGSGAANTSRPSSGGDSSGGSGSSPAGGPGSGSNPQQTPSGGGQGADPTPGGGRSGSGRGSRVAAEVARTTASKTQRGTEGVLGEDGSAPGSGAEQR